LVRCAGAGRQYQLVILPDELVTYHGHMRSGRYGYLHAKLTG
jgi:hypothetical protein